jgi:hypothetical protein
MTKTPLIIFWLTLALLGVHALLTGQITGLLAAGAMLFCSQAVPAKNTLHPVVLAVMGMSLAAMLLLLYFGGVR